MYEGYEDIHRIGWGKDVNFYKVQDNIDGTHCIVHVCTRRMTIIEKNLSREEADRLCKNLNDACITTKEGVK